MGSHPMFIAANGWTYVDGGCIVYLLLAFVCLMRSRSAARADVWIIAAGCCWAALVYTYLLWLVLTPCCAIFYLGLTTNSRLSGQRVPAFLRARHLIASGQFLGGALMATMVLQTIQLLIHGVGYGFFFRHNIAAAISLGSGDNSFAQPGYAWIASNGSLVFPAVTFVACLAALLLHRSGRRRLGRASLGIVGTYIYAFLVLVFLTVYRARTLQFGYCDSMLIPLLFLVWGVTMLPTPKHLVQWLFGAVVVMGFLFSTLSLWKVGLFAHGLPGRLWVHYIIAMTGAMLPLFSARPSVWAVSVACFSGASFGLVPESPSRAWAANYNGLSASIRIGDAIRRIEASLPYNKLPVFWIDYFTSPYSSEYRAIMCSFLTHSLSMWHYPNIGVGVNSLAPEYISGTQIVLITQRRDVFEQAQNAMAEMGMPLHLTGQQFVSRENISYWLTFTEVADPTEQPGAVSDAVRVPLTGGLQLAYEKAAMERVGRSWRVVTASQQWAYAARVPLPAVKTGRWRGAIRIRGHVVRGRIGFGLLNRSQDRFVTEEFVDGSSQETDFSLPIDFSDDIGYVMVRNAGAGGPSEVVVDSIDLALAGRKVTEWGELRSLTAASAGVSVTRGQPTTILWATEPGFGAASIPLSLKNRPKGVFYLQVKAQVQSGRITVEVRDRNNKDNREERVLERENVTGDVFVRIPSGLQEGEIHFRNAASAGIRSRAIVVDVVVWQVI
jgi:hypothetical protein